MQLPRRRIGLPDHSTKRAMSSERASPRVIVTDAVTTKCRQIGDLLAGRKSIQEQTALRGSVALAHEILIAPIQTADVGISESRRTSSSDSAMMLSRRQTNFV